MLWSHNKLNVLTTDFNIWYDDKIHSSEDILSEPALGYHGCKETFIMTDYIILWHLKVAVYWLLLSKSGNVIFYVKNSMMTHKQVKKKYPMKSTAIFCQYFQPVFVQSKSIIANQVIIGYFLFAYW